MFLADRTIKKLVESGYLIIRPFEPSHLRGASYVMSLGAKFIRFRNDGLTVDPFDKTSISNNILLEENQDAITIPPGRFILAGTNEKVGLPEDMVGLVFNLSHLARIGLDMTLGSMMISPGFGISQPTNIALEIVNHNPCSVRLRAGMPICYLAFVKTDIATSRPYDKSVGTYSGQDSPVSSRYFYDYERSKAKSVQSELGLD